MLSTLNPTIQYVNQQIERNNESDSDSVSSTGPLASVIPEQQRSPARIGPQTLSPMASVSNNGYFEATEDTNQIIYERTLKTIQERYQSFDPETKMGFNGTDGVTGDIEFITRKDLIGILKHIKETPHLFETCVQKSSTTPFFDKLYLMSDREQGWNLRIHRINVRGNGFGTEDSPHYHRWTLATKILSGGYMNVEFKEKPVNTQQSTPYDFYKYELEPTPKDHGGTGTRPIKFLEQVTLEPSTRRLYKKDDLLHFPVENPHSVKPQARYMGTTMTLAHTSHPHFDVSYSFQKDGGMSKLEERRLTDQEDFIEKFDRNVVHLQLLELSDELNLFLQNRQSQGESLTESEMKHLSDYPEFNYLETSLLPALGILKLQGESDRGRDDREFSADTETFIAQRLQTMDPNALEEIIAYNQEDLFAEKLDISLDNTLFQSLIEKRERLPVGEKPYSQNA